MSKPKKITYEQAKEKWPHSASDQYSSLEYKLILVAMTDVYNQAITDMEQYKKSKRDKLTQVDNGTCSMSEIYKLAEKIQSVSNFVDAILRDTRSMFPELQSRIDQLETLHENHCIATAHQRDKLFDRVELLEHQSKDMGNGIDDSLQRVEKLEQFNKCQIVTNSVDLKYLEDYENRISKLETQMAVIQKGETGWQKSVIRDGDKVRIITSDRTVIHKTK